ncbi:hypothetical protein PGT21_004217 [Puccinia graminis f. sp. tritici]|uniref:Uncharacterized protein n=1 Tax=Puccinia graminis f. sp. tritici TaxID=56615 RepID=A0A5B0RXJ7_PUCGR|nr:hypothetical protein PGTUg99_036221 [Puccinia graminis f. sp. tritici]KAA1093952.1 hypothetical protein PGT21_004217 [Puccinia graminis f. sp. tritici]KAA1130098.1 hypothetical protein PGTUg99_010657 [Puccinia graminis f. sp. tritici]
MERTRKFFRLKNSSKDSDLSFHCCGKPDDLLDEPLDFVNTKRQPSGQAELTNPETKISERHLDSMLVATLCNEHRLMKEMTSSEALQSAPGPSGRRPLKSLLFRSTASSPNLQRKSRVQRTKLWAKKYIEPRINDKAFAYEEMKYYTRQEADKPQEDAASKEDIGPRLRSARSMPMLNEAAFSNMPASHRRRAKCLSSFSFSGLDALVGMNCDQTKGTSSNDMPYSPMDDSYPLDNATTRTDSAQSTSSKLQTSIFSKNSKFSSFLSAVSWNSLLRHRQEKDG